MLRWYNSNASEKAQTIAACKEFDHKNSLVSVYIYIYVGIYNLLLVAKDLNSNIHICKCIYRQYRHLLLIFAIM